MSNLNDTYETPAFVIEMVNERLAKLPPAITYKTHPKEYSAVIEVGVEFSKRHFTKSKELRTVITLFKRIRQEYELNCDSESHEWEMPGRPCLLRGEMRAYCDAYEDLGVPKPYFVENILHAAAHNNRSTLDMEWVKEVESSSFFNVSFQQTLDWLIEHEVITKEESLIFNDEYNEFDNISELRV